MIGAHEKAAFSEGGFFRYEAVPESISSWRPNRFSHVFIVRKSALVMTRGSAEKFEPPQHDIGKLKENTLPC